MVQGGAGCFCTPGLGRAKLVVGSDVFLRLIHVLHLGARILAVSHAISFHDVVGF